VTISQYLDIPESILKKHLIPKDYEKPRIEIGNYFLKWDDDNKSYGIHRREIAELKGFLKKAIILFDTSYELLSKLEKGKHKDKYPLHTGLSPLVFFSYRNKDHRVSYELYMGSDGSTFIDRVEKIEISNNNNYILADKDKEKLPQLHDIRPRLYLKWSLGELLFNRQAKHF
jgi:hypothetical protein